MLQFEHKNYLFALAAILLFVFLFYLLKKWKQEAVAKIGDASLVQFLTASFSTKKLFLKFLLSGVAFALIVIAMANLQIRGGKQSINRNGIDVMIALDVSKSMLAEDLKPNRLERAKQLLTKLTNQLSDNRIGLVIFAGSAYLQMPLTTDHSATKLFINSINIDAVPTQGTVISDALALCNQSFNSDEKKYKSIILITDGEDHDANATAVASQLYNEGVQINTVGIGSPEGAPIILSETGEYKKDKEGNTIISKLNESILKEIAENTNGNYLQLNDSDAASALLSSQIASMEQKGISDKSFMNYKSLFQWFLVIAFILLLIEFFIAERKRVKRLQKIVAICFGLLFLNVQYSLAQNDVTYIKKGNEAYVKNDFVSAANQYLLASIDNPVAQFNLGNALFRQNKIPAALAAYNNALKNGTTRKQRAMAYYNSGVVLHNNNQLEDCINAYKNALRIDPTDDDARQNLQKALKKLQQTKPKPKKENKPNKPKEEKNKKQKKPKEGKQQPKPQPANITKQDADEKLKVLQEKEKAAQDKFKRVLNTSSKKPDKDW